MFTLHHHRHLTVVRARKHINIFCPIEKKRKLLSYMYIKNQYRFQFSCLQYTPLSEIPIIRFC